MRASPEGLADSVASLVRIPSVNPLQTGPKAEAAGAIGEAALAEHIAGRLTGCGATEVVLDEVLDGRPNVYGFIEGRTERLVVLDVHTDTVTVEHMTDPPFDGRVVDGGVWGRGALDTKASMGVILALLDEWHRAGLRPAPTLLVVGTMSEEAGGLLGAARFRQWADERALDVDQLVVAEPTQLAPVYGHKGAVGIKVVVHGRSAHSALPQLGDNAIEAMAHVISAYEAEHQRLQTAPATSELGHSTISVTMIKGGTGGNVIPERCSIIVTQRLVPGQTPNGAYERLQEIAAMASPLPVTCTPLRQPTPDGEPGARAFLQPADTTLVRDFADWAGTTPVVAPYGTNALRYDGFAREVIVFGPGNIDDAHQATEHVEVADLELLAEVYTAWLRPQ